MRACAPVSTSPGAHVVKEGFLSKRAVSAHVFKPWRTRRVVLKQRVIEWHREDPSQPSMVMAPMEEQHRGDITDDSEPAGSMGITQETQLAVKGNVFTVCTNHRQLHLRAQDDRTQLEWMEAISTVLRELLDEQKREPRVTSAGPAAGAPAGAAAVTESRPRPVCIESERVSWQLLWEEPAEEEGESEDGDAGLAAGALGSPLSRGAKSPQHRNNGKWK